VKALQPEEHILWRCSRSSWESCLALCRTPQ